MRHSTFEMVPGRRRRIVGICTHGFLWIKGTRIYRVQIDFYCPVVRARRWRPCVCRIVLSYNVDEIEVCLPRPGHELCVCGAIPGGYCGLTRPGDMRGTDLVGQVAVLWIVVGVLIRWIASKCWVWRRIVV